MLQKFDDFDDISISEQLPKGGYILRILNVDVKENDYGLYLILSCDIAEGEYKGFYMKAYNALPSTQKKWKCNYLLSIPQKSSEEWVKRAFKKLILNLEKSNPGFKWKWEEKDLKGLYIGGLFNFKDFPKDDGSIGHFTHLKRLCGVELIRSGSYELPEDERLKPIEKNNQSDDLFKDGFIKAISSDDDIPFEI